MHNRSRQFATVGAVALSVMVGLVAVSAPPAAAASVAGTFVKLAPYRVTVGTVAAHGSKTVQLGGVDSIPASGANTAVFGVTATAATAAGSLVVYPAATAIPTVTTLSFSAGRTSSVTTTVRLNSSGALTVSNSGSSSVSIFFDIVGYYAQGSVTTPGGFSPVTATRAASISIPAHGTVNVQLAGRAGIPSTGAAAAALTLTAVSPTAAGSSTVYAAGAAAPGAGTVSFTAGLSTTNSALSRLSAAGAVTISNTSSSGLTVHLDVAGWFRSGTPTVTGAVVPLPPARLFDTTVGVGQGRSVQVTGLGGVPAEGVTAVAVNIAVISPTAAGSVTTFPAGAVRPALAEPYFASGQPASSLAIVRVGDGGKIDVYQSSSTGVRVVADVVGYVRNTPGFTWSAPRAIDLPTGYMSDVSCVSTSFCVAVDSDGNAVVGGQGAWSAPAAVDPGQDLRAVSCATVTFCAAVDDGGGAIVYTGSAWSTRTAIGSAGLADVACVSANFCIALDSGGGWTRWNGTSWSVPGPLLFGALPGATGLALDCSTSSACVAVASDGYASTFNGTKWTAATTVATSLTPLTLSCPSATTCWVLDSGQQTYRFNGSTWSKSAAASTPTVDSMSCTTSTNCTAIIGEYNDDAYIFNGSTWSSALAVPDPEEYEEYNPLDVISCVTGGCQAVAQFNTIWKTSSEWAGPVLIDPSESQLVGVSCTSPTSCVALGNHNAVVYTGNDAWSAPKSLLQDNPGDDNGTNNFTSVSCASASFCGASWRYLEDDGDESESVEIFNGSSWTQQTGPTAQTLSIDCADPSFCAVVQVDGFTGTNQALIYRSGTWGSPVDFPGEYLDTVSCVSSTFCIAVGRGDQFGAYWRWNGSTWSYDTRSADPQGGDVSCASTTFCVSVSGGAQTFNGTTWSAPVTVGSADFTTVSCTSSIFCLAMTSDGQISRFNGSTWTSPTTIDANGLVSLSCSSSTFCVGVDAKGYAVYGY